jgi:hypothetical protein
VQWRLVAEALYYGFGIINCRRPAMVCLYRQSSTFTVGFSILAFVVGFWQLLASVFFSAFLQLLP